jgi:hypothetical protein
LFEPGFFLLNKVDFRKSLGFKEALGKNFNSTIGLY